MSEESKMFSLDSKYMRNVFTWHYNGDEPNPWFKFGYCKYIIYGREICPTTGRKHLQGYVEWAHQRRGSTLKNINKDIHWEKVMGTQAQAIEYCKKDGDFTEFGEKRKQGERRDIQQLRDDILEQKKTLDEITVEDPMAYHQYGRTLTKLEDIALRNKFRKWMTTCDWYYGGSGVGKSHIAFKDYSPETHYVWTNDRGWWDGYTGQETIIINEFRGEINFKDLLEYIDKWPLLVSRRGRERAPFLAKHIIITSPMPPKEIYACNEEKDDFYQLERRINLYHIKPDRTVWKVVKGNTGLDLFINVDEYDSWKELQELMNIKLI